MKPCFSASRPSLTSLITSHAFHPEVYSYPPPRTYQPISDLGTTPSTLIESIDFRDPTNLYFHVPFCSQLCEYCGYVKMVPPKQSDSLFDSFVDALVAEIQLYDEVLADKTVLTFHIGGGTPSLLSVDQMSRIIGTVLEINPTVLTTSEEVSLEATPSTVVADPEKFIGARELGINRVSIGVQSLVDEELVLCNRQRTSSSVGESGNSKETNLRAIEILKQEVKIPNLVVDVMIGLEGQTPESFELTCSQLLGDVSLRPDTVEFYAIGLMPNTSLFDSSTSNSSQFMTTEEIHECYSIGRKLFLEAGYIQDCHNRYALPDSGSFLQEDYVFLDLDLIGFGPGTRSYTQRTLYRNRLYPHDHKRTVMEYIDGMLSTTEGKEKKDTFGMVQDAVILSQEEKMRQYAMFRIEEMDLREFENLWGVSFVDWVGEEWFGELLDLGLAIVDGGDEVLKLTDVGLNFRDVICREFYSEESNLAEESYRSFV